MLKRIHKTEYLYKFKRGRFYISLIHNDMGYHLPNRYLSQDDMFIPRLSSLSGFTDNGDIEWWECKFDNIHTRENQSWVDLKSLESIYIPGNESYVIYYNIYYHLFSNVDALKDAYKKSYYDITKALESYKQYADDILKRMCKLKYISTIKTFINEPDNGIAILDAWYEPMDNALLEKELETLEHYDPYIMETPNGPFDRVYDFDIHPLINIFGGKIHSIML